MDEGFQGIIIDALTEALAKKTAVTIQNNINKSMIVISATNTEIVVSLSRMPTLMDDIIHTISHSLGSGADMVYNRNSMLSGDFVIYYMVWLLNDEDGVSYIKNEFSLAQNNITYMSTRALSYIMDLN